MNILLSAYSVNPYHGSEDGVGWNWTLQLSRNYPDSTIYLLTKRFNEEDTKRGIAEAGLTNVRLVIVDVPNALNWFREKYSVFHHMYYFLWQNVAYNWAKKSKIKFDIVHHITMGDFRFTGKMYKFKDAYTIYGPVGGGQSTPKPLKCYERNKAVEKFRELINKSRAISPFYSSRLRKFDKIYAINGETRQLMDKASGNKSELLMDISIADEFKALEIEEHDNITTSIVFVGRLIEKKGLMLLLDAISAINTAKPFKLTIYGDGALRAQIEEFIRQNRLENIVILAGNVDHSEITRAYRNADIFIMPSLRETGGTVLVEAMAHKLPVVALDMSICSQLKRYNCGIFVDVEQKREDIVNDMAKAICTLAENSELRKAMGNNGYRYANNIATWENKFETVYGKLKAIK